MTARAFQAPGAKDGWYIWNLLECEELCRCNIWVTCELKWWAISGALLSISFPDLTVMTLFVTSSKVSRTKPNSIAPIHCLLPTKFLCLSPEHAKRKTRIKNGCVLGLYQSCISIDEGCNYTLRVIAHNKKRSSSEMSRAWYGEVQDNFFLCNTRDDRVLAKSVIAMTCDLLPRETTLQLLLMFVSRQNQALI